MAPSYPENTVWYIEARPWSGPDRKNPGFASDKDVSKGSGVVITLTQELANGERKPRTYILTCAHVVRDSSDYLLEDIICYPPGQGFIRTTENNRLSGKGIAQALPAVVSIYSPCKGERGSRPDELKDDPSSDWVLLEVDESSFRNQASVKTLCEDDLPADQTLQVIGFPGGDATWEDGYIVSATISRGFRVCSSPKPKPGMIDYEGPEETRRGMSGCGMFDEKGTLVGIHRSYTDATMKRSGVRIDGIIRQLQQIHEMEFAPGIRPSSASGDPVTQAKKQLKDLLWDFELDDDLDDLVRNEIKRLSREGVASDDEELLEKIGNAYNDHGEWQALVNFLGTLDKKRKNITAGPDYAKLARQLDRGEVILCLGQEISHLSGAPIPSTAEIKKLLSQDDFHGPLSELCEQKLIAPDSSRTDLINELRDLLDKKNASIALYDLFIELKKPVIVITAGYDKLLQKNLRANERKFVEIYPNMEEGKCLLVYSDQQEQPFCPPDDISSYDLLENGYSIIYRLRGGIVGGQEHLLLAERDYFTFNRLIEQQFPEYISSKMKSSLYSLWFIGHYPQSWEERLLVAFLKELQHKDASSLAVQENIPPFDQDFWQFKKVTVYDINLAEFVRDLGAAL
ncbi:SIR2-like domain-containing protein [Candidatus Electrothrix aarhusensis]|uniref:SIR2-like domain-containing protein n=1 Tax=Candidatus Electrothrix aarhusensis TaxID=1859131 RepID=A0A444IQ86_9BACT|nr:SIR2-like domain-containing protein [Candidatus Electrothrix aarhusensis]